MWEEPFQIGFRLVGEIKAARGVFLRIVLLMGVRKGDDTRQIERFQRSTTGRVKEGRFDQADC